MQLTSSNSSWNGSWKLKLGGFSLANFVTEPLSLVCGTPYYMAPEMLMETGWAIHKQARSLSRQTSWIHWYLIIHCYRYGTKIDVWSAGVICYILLSGTMPFRRYIVSLIRYTNHHMWYNIIVQKPQEEQHRYACQHKVWTVLFPLPLLGPHIWGSKG